MKYSVAGEVIASAFKLTRSLPSPGGINLEYWFTLQLIANGFNQPSHLAAELKVKRPTISSLLNELESRRLIERTQSATDRRQIIIKVTRGGHKALNQASQRDISLVENLLSELEPHQVVELNRTLRQLADVVEVRIQD